MKPLDLREYTQFCLAEGRVVSGLANCHVPGLVSLVLEPRRSHSIGMLRVFYAQATAINDLLTGDDFSVLPHNHRQDITLVHLAGTEPINVHLSLLNVGTREHLQVWEYGFGSALLDGQFTLVPHGVRMAALRESPITTRGLFLPSAAVHTVRAEEGAAWAVQEGKVATHATFCYSLKRDLQLDQADLYRPLSSEEISRCVAEILQG